LQQIITDMATIHVMPDALVLREVAPGVCVDDVKAATGARCRAVGAENDGDAAARK
jgi:acyl CoA:acetate/3-ketoacid CoA transferase beta subunit